MLVRILKLEGLLQGYVKWKNIMTGNVNFMTQNVGSETSLLDKNVEIDRNITICALSFTFLMLVCILKLECLLQGYVKWKNIMTGNVNFMTQNVGSETSLLDKNVEIDRNITILCPFRYIFDASVHFKVGRSSSRLC